VSQHQICLCTCPDEETAQSLATSLVEANLAACVNILPAVQSVYKWKGILEKDQEVLLLIKTQQHRFSEIESHILARHPYELPEIIAVPIEAGLKPYLQWIDDVMESEQ